MNKLYIGGRNRSNRLRKNDPGDADQILSKIAKMHGRDSDDDAYDYKKDMKHVHQQAVLKPVSLRKSKQSENDRFEQSYGEAIGDRKDAMSFLRRANSIRKQALGENNSYNQSTYQNSNADGLITCHAKPTNRDESHTSHNQNNTSQKWNWFPFIQTSQKLNTDVTKETLKTSDDTLEDKIHTARETDSLYSSEDAQVPVAKPNDSSMNPSHHALGKTLVPKSLGNKYS